MRPRVLFYVQHLLGIGHLVRAGRLAAALGESFDVLLAIGGDLPPGLDLGGATLVRLPSVKAGPGGFGTLVRPDGTPFSDADKAARRDALLAAFDGYRPEVLLIEAFPFGRRQMRFELLPLLERASAAARRPLVACSVRDILQDSRSERRAETVDLLRRHFDMVLVHGDVRLARLDDSFPEAASLGDLIDYTGIVAAAPGPAEPRDVGCAVDGPFDVVVSVGGGAVGSRLVEAALAARPLSGLAAARWLVLTGPNGRLPDLPADPGVAVRPFVSDLAGRLAEARLSISQAGYNTVADILAARCRAVLVPFATDGETEQTRRAELLAERRLVVSLPERDLGPATLASAVDAALTLPEPGLVVALDGASATRRALERRLGAR